MSMGHAVKYLFLLLCLNLLVLVKVLLWPRVGVPFTRSWLRAVECVPSPLLGSCLLYLGISYVTMLIFNKRPSPSGLGQNIPNKCGIICVPANGTRPEQCLANNISQTVWSMKHKFL